MTVNHELGEILSRVEKLAKTTPSLQRDTVIPADTAGSGHAQTRCLMLPEVKKRIRLFDRVEVFEQLDELLSKASDMTTQSVALFGMGGVGKTTIATTYVQRKFEKHAYHVVLWAHAEKPLALRQSFTNIALRLKLDGAHPQKHEENLLLVQDWFQTTGKSFAQHKFSILMEKGYRLHVDHCL